MKFKISKKWCANAAKKEHGTIVAAGKQGFMTQFQLGYRNIYWNTTGKFIWKHDELYGTVKTAQKHISKHRQGLIHIGVEYISLNYCYHNTVILYIPLKDPKHPGFEVPWKTLRYNEYAIFRGIQ